MDEKSTAVPPSDEILGRVVNEVPSPPLTTTPFVDVLVTEYVVYGSKLLISVPVVPATLYVVVVPLTVILIAANEPSYETVALVS